VVILNLTVLPQATSVVNDTICSSSAGVVIGTQTFSLAGSYTVTLSGASAAGCDSVVTLNLTVNAPLSLEFTLNGTTMGSVATNGGQALCNNDDVLILLSGVGQGQAPVSGLVRVWLGGIGFSLNRTIQANGLQVGDTLYYAAAGTVPAGEYTVEVLSATDANGCSIDTSGAIYQFNYVVNETSATTLNEVICSPNSFAVGGQSFNASGIYTVTLTNQEGCDSVVTLNLTVNQPSGSSLSVALCPGGSFAVGGQSFNTSGTYTVTLVNALGCDSILTLTVTVASGTVTPQLASLTLPEQQATAGQVVRIPVYAEYVSQVDAFNLGIHFDPSVMTYQNVDVSGTALSGQPFVIGNANGTRVEVSYFALSGQPALDVCGDVLLYLEFLYHGPTGGISPLVWDESYTSFTPAAQAQYTGVVLDNGLVYSNQVTTGVPQSNGDVRVCAFTDATLTVTGSGITSYQWMVSTDGGSSFVNLVNGSGISGAQSASLVLSSVLTSMSGNLYMCRVDGVGGPTASVAQRLRVDEVVGIGMSVVASPAGVQCPGTQVTYSAQPSAVVGSAV
jgi:hypothetical protein